MPLYEFQCTECKRTFEELVQFSTAVVEVKCPKCGSSQVRRKVSTFASRISGGARGGATAPASSCAPGGT